MDEKELLKRANELREEFVGHRRYLHENAEMGFDLEETLQGAKDSIEATY